MVPQVALLPGICTVKDIDCCRAVSSLVTRRQVRGKVRGHQRSSSLSSIHNTRRRQLFETPLIES